MALISTKARRAYPLRIEHVVRSEAEKAVSKGKASDKQRQPPAAKRKPGRPKDSKNRPTALLNLSPELQRIQIMLQAQRQLIAGSVPLVYLALAGHCGKSPTLQMVRGCGLHLISKVRSDAALYLPYDGPYHGRGPRRKYGEKLDVTGLPAQCLRERHVEDGVERCISHVEVLHKEFPQPLNVVVIVKTNLRTQARAHVLVFSSDLTLSFEKLVA